MKLDYFQFSLSIFSCHHLQVYYHSQWEEDHVMTIKKESQLRGTIWHHYIMFIAVMVVARFIYDCIHIIIPRLIFSHKDGHINKFRPMKITYVTTKQYTYFTAKHNSLEFYTIHTSYHSWVETAYVCIYMYTSITCCLWVFTSEVYESM